MRVSFFWWNVVFLIHLQHVHCWTWTKTYKIKIVIINKEPHRQCLHLLCTLSLDWYISPPQFSQHVLQQHIIIPTKGTNIMNRKPATRQVIYPTSNFANCKRKLCKKIKLLYIFAKIIYKATKPKLIYNQHPRCQCMIYSHFEISHWPLFSIHFATP